MIRGLWTIVAVLSVVHVMALLGVLGWLGATNRVDADRLSAVRALFTPTIDEARAASGGDAGQPDPKAGTPAPAEARIGVVDELEKAALIRRDRLGVDAQILRETLVREREALDEDRAAFETERDAFEAMRERIRAREGDAQFAKAVKLYESLRPEEAGPMLRALIAKPGGMERAVAYLNAMAQRPATKLLKQIQEADAALASDLVESVRTFGLEAASAEDAADDPTP